MRLIMTLILTIILCIIGYIQDSPIFFLAIICLLFFRLLIKSLVRVAERVIQDEDKFDNIMLAISDLKSDIESKLSEIQDEVSLRG